MTLEGWLFDALRSNATFAAFFADTIQAGLINCAARYKDAASKEVAQTRGFIYGERYSIFDVMRMCCWKNEQVPRNVGGYKLDLETDSLPIFINYEGSQYEDRFLNNSEIEWYSKTRRTVQSPEFTWLMKDSENENWERSHFVPVFIRRVEEDKEKLYYYVGNVATINHVQQSKNNQGLNVVVSTLQLNTPVNPQLFRHLTGKSSV